MAQPEADDTQRWVDAWGADILGLIQGKGILGPDNNGVQILYGTASHQQKAQKKAKDLVAALYDWDVDPNQAVDITYELYRLFLKEKEMLQANKKLEPGFPGISGFPTSTYNDIFELINAKRVWKAGCTQLLPWPHEADAKKPDYAVGPLQDQHRHLGPDAFYTAVDPVGDHIKIKSCATMDKLYEQIGSGVQSKLTAYPTKSVWVVVDGWDNVVAWQNPTDPVRVRAAIKERAASGLKRLHRVDVVLPKGQLLTVTPNDLG